MYNSISNIDQVVTFLNNRNKMRIECHNYQYSHLGAKAIHVPYNAGSVKQTIMRNWKKVGANGVFTAYKFRWKFEVVGNDIMVALDKNELESLRKYYTENFPNIELKF